MLVQVNPATTGLRLDFTLILPEGATTELRAELWRGGQVVAEVWLNRWTQT